MSRLHWVPTTFSVHRKHTVVMGREWGVGWALVGAREMRGKHVNMIRTRIFLGQKIRTNKVHRLYRVPTTLFRTKVDTLTRVGFDLARLHLKMTAHILGNLESPTLL